MNNYESDTTVSHKTISTVLGLLSMCCFLTRSWLNNSIYRHSPIKQKSLKCIHLFEELCRFPDCGHRGGNCRQGFRLCDLFDPDETVVVQVKLCKNKSSFGLVFFFLSLTAYCYILETR